MHTLTLEYKHKPRTYRAPQNWNELTAVQLIQWAAVAFGDIKDGNKLRMAVAIMYGIEWKVFRKLDDHYKAQLFPGIEFLFKQCKVDKWLLKKFRIGYRYYYGPADKLTNLSANEFFNYTEVLYQNYYKTKSEKALDALCAILFRPKRKSIIYDDTRDILTDAGIALRAKKFGSMHIAVKHAILLNYEGCRSFIIRLNHEVFKENGQLKRNKTPHDMVLSLSNGPFGDYDHTKNANLYKFLQHMNRLIEQAEEAKR